MAQDLDAPRIRFNWGYHDAAREYAQGKTRELVDEGEYSPTQVPRSANEFYYLGYIAGFQDASSGEYFNDSNPAWRYFLDNCTPQERKAIWQEQFECERDGLADCLGHPVNAYIVERASEYAWRAMGR